MTVFAKQHLLWALGYNPGDWKELDAAQREYERQLIADYEAALQTLGVIV